MSDPRVGIRGEDAALAGRIVDPRAVRVGLAPPSAQVGVEALVIEPPAVPLAPAPHVAGAGTLAGVAIVDGVPVQVRLRHVDGMHATLIEAADDGPSRRAVLLMPIERRAGPAAGTLRREVVVDGWRVEVEVESERRASLRERARRGREETARGGPTQVRAIIPGRIVSVSIVPGDPVEAGQQLLVVEAMKMQNELRAPRDGIVSSVAVGLGATIEVGDLMLVLE
jgi:biotin carboxyl carrier protein